MSRISLIMDQGKRSMANNQTALSTVGHNIANKSTEGYSRQRVEIQSNVPISEGRLQIGTGAKAALVTRVNNPYLEKQIQKEGSHAGFLDARAESLGRLEQIYNEQMNKGLSHYMTEFFNSFRELANYPESPATRTLVRESSQMLVNNFRQVNKDLSAVQGDLDLQVKVHVEEINQLTKEIANLNEKISTIEIQGIPSNDERDRRDLLLKKLNEKIDITWGENDRGQVAVTAARNAVLVSGYSHQNLEVKNSDHLGQSDIYITSDTGLATKITSNISGGRLGAVLSARDQMVEGLRHDVDQLAYTFATEVNRIHRQGYDLLGRQGADFFQEPESIKGAASELTLSEGIKKSVNAIVAGLNSTGVADNIVANVISNLQDQTLLNEGTATMDEFYRSTVGDIGVLSQRATNESEAQRQIVSQLNTLRESISGVSLDEEATKMIEYQKGFDASARLIRTADEMFDTILNLKRL